MDFQRSARRLRAAALLPMLALGLAACGDDDDVTTPEGPGNIAQVALEEPRLSTLVSLLQQSGLSGDLAGPGPFTVFAPVNGAFEDLPLGWAQSLLDEANEELLVKILGYHVVQGTFLAEDLTDGRVLNTVQGTQLTVSRASGGAVTITDVSDNPVAVIEADLEASNGVIHLTDDIFVPELDVVEMARISGYSALVELVEEAGLTETLEGDGPFTIFAPNDLAFEGIVKPEDPTDIANILGYHVIEDQALFAGDLTTRNGETLETAQGELLEIVVDEDAGTVSVQDLNGNVFPVTRADIAGTNGVIHGIEGVLLPGFNIAEVAQLYGLTGLVDAVVDAGLGDVVTDPAQSLTVFAPYNESFEALPVDGDGNPVVTDALLTNIVAYHVTAGEFFAADLADGQSFPMLNDPAELESVTVSIDEATGAVSLTDEAGNVVNILETDIRASNGVIHTIDALLTPSLNVVETATVNGFTTLVDLLETATLEGTPLSEILSDETEEFTVFAPTNEAFEGLSAVPEGEALTGVLLYHVASGTVLSSSLVDGQDVTALSQEIFRVNISGDGAVTITDASENTVNVGPVDVLSNNGVIHVIDGVLLPAV